MLLNECVDARLAAHLTGVEVRTVHDEGWTGISNGALLARAQEKFNVLLTVDRNLTFQQHIPKFRIAVVVMHCTTNRLSDLVTLVPALQHTIPNAPAGVVTEVGR